MLKVLSSVQNTSSAGFFGRMAAILGTTIYPCLCSNSSCHAHHWMRTTAGLRVFAAYVLHQTLAAFDTPNRLLTFSDRLICQKTTKADTSLMREVPAPQVSFVYEQKCGYAQGQLFFHRAAMTAGARSVLALSSVFIERRKDCPGSAG